MNKILILLSLILFATAPAMATKLEALQKGQQYLHESADGKVEIGTVVSTYLGNKLVAWANSSYGPSVTFKTEKGLKTILTTDSDYFWPTTGCDSHGNCVGAETDFIQGGGGFGGLFVGYTRVKLRALLDGSTSKNPRFYGEVVSTVNSGDSYKAGEFIWGWPASSSPKTGPCAKDGICINDQISFAGSPRQDDSKIIQGRVTSIFENNFECNRDVAGDPPYGFILTTANNERYLYAPECESGVDESKAIMSIPSLAPGALVYVPCSMAGGVCHDYADEYTRAWIIVANKSMSKLQVEAPSRVEAILHNGALAISDGCINGLGCTNDSILSRQWKRVFKIVGIKNNNSDFVGTSEQITVLLNANESFRLSGCTTSGRVCFGNRVQIKTSGRAFEVAGIHGNQLVLKALDGAEQGELGYDWSEADVSVVQ